jgi:transcriptional regulator with XRE-family HTH domain
MDPENTSGFKKNVEYMGTMIRQAREEMGMSQEELADRTFRRRLNVSEMENGKTTINAWTLLILSDVLKKPLSYFFPPHLVTDIPDNSLSPKEHELITYFRKIYDEDLEKVTLNIVKNISSYIPVDVHTAKIEKAMEEENPQEFLNLLLNRKPKKDL